VDRGIALLRAHGIEHAIVNAGGDLRAIGRRGERPWRIGIRAPRDSRVLAAIEVRDDEAVFTSGDYERYFEYQGRRYHHILDPRSGYPTEGITSVTILHANAGLADAAATALLVAGPADWPAMAAALGVRSVMVVLADGAIELTELMEPRTWFTDEAERASARVRPLP
jgi:FAD:protein FMN transferase